MRCALSFPCPFSILTCFPVFPFFSMPDVPLFPIPDVPLFPIPDVPLYYNGFSFYKKEKVHCTFSRCFLADPCRRMSLIRIAGYPIIRLP